MATDDALQQGREYFERQAWRAAHDRLSSADAESRLDPEDLGRLAACAYMLGNEVESAELLERAHHEFLKRGDAEQAAQSAFRLGFELMMRGMIAPASGWLARARRVVEETGQESVVHGYLLMPEGIRCVRENPAHGYELFSRALDTGKRFHDLNLVGWARLGQGRALIKMGRIPEGVALLDEMMVAVTAGEVPPIHVGDIYCSVIDACTEIFDLRRAHEWTDALSQWCEGQSERIFYRGACMVRRAEILQLHGSWADAMTEAEHACAHLIAPPPKPAAGTANYQRGELHRLRGEFDRAEDAYRQASELGRKPQPGLALMRLAQGDTDAALASIRRVVDEAREPSARARALAAYVEILLAANEIDTARIAATELSEIAVSLDAAIPRAMAAHGEAAVSLAEGDAESAVRALRVALDLWREAEAPYEEARSRELMAVASRVLGDADTAELELDAARRAFQRLGALTDVARVKEIVRQPTSGGTRGRQLTSRELEVLALVATGKTNRAIADTLRLSEKTVARHVSNIFTKLGVSTRAAATAYAYRNRLV